MQENALTANLMMKIGLDSVHAFTTHDRRLVLYPCRRGQVLNVAGIYPSDPGTDESHNASWHNAGSLEELLDTFQDFSDELQEMCRMVEDVKLWSLASRDPAPTFVRGKLALIGDAAHPMLPRAYTNPVPQHTHPSPPHDYHHNNTTDTTNHPDQGQGAALASEDAAALAGVLPEATSVDQLPERLDLYNRLRYAHAVTVMIMSRTADERREEMLDEFRRFVPGAVSPECMFGYMWTSDPIGEARRVVEAS
jgi:salicylate hydroxylase